MNIIDGMIEELKHEVSVTRRVLERIPEDKFNYTPHEKSFTMGALGSHVADSLGWATPTCTMDRMEFDAENWEFWQGSTAAELTAKLDENLASAVDVMKPVTNEDLFKNWAMVDMQGNVMLEMPRIQVLRSMLINHMIHHRGQLSVYLRINDIPVPAIYGPSADEKG
jgi:uncharacterized damage-inducible protein DinB